MSSARSPTARSSRRSSTVSCAAFQRCSTSSPRRPVWTHRTAVVRIPGRFRRATVRVDSARSKAASRRICASARGNPEGSPTLSRSSARAPVRARLREVSAEEVPPRPRPRRWEFGSPAGVCASTRCTMTCWTCGPAGLHLLLGGFEVGWK